MESMSMLMRIRRNDLVSLTFGTGVEVLEEFFEYIIFGFHISQTALEALVI